MLKGVDLTRPATDNQKPFLKESLDQLPRIKDGFEYEDYLSNPTIGNASELISSTAENYDRMEITVPKGKKESIKLIRRIS